MIDLIVSKLERLTERQAGTASALGTVIGFFATLGFSLWLGFGSSVWILILAIAGSFVGAVVMTIIFCWVANTAAVDTISGAGIDGND